MERQKRIVYIVRSDNFPSRHYTGITSDVRARLQWHNRSTSGYGVRYRPWSLVVSIEFPTEPAARRFERYLKSGSGRAFAKRHFGVVDPASSSRMRTARGAAGIASP
jgi:predicted GIY-YIG superfamily endonuclease